MEELLLAIATSVDATRVAAAAAVVSGVSKSDVGEIYRKTLGCDMWENWGVTCGKEWGVTSGI